MSSDYWEDTRKQGRISSFTWPGSHETSYPGGGTKSIEGFWFLNSFVNRPDATLKLPILKALLSDCQHLETPRLTGCFLFKLDLPSAAGMPSAAWPCASLLPVTQLGPRPAQHNRKTPKELHWQDGLSVATGYSKIFSPRSHTQLDSLYSPWRSRHILRALCPSLTALHKAHYVPLRAGPHRKATAATRRRTQRYWWMKNWTWTSNVVHVRSQKADHILGCI